ncbi:MAG: hypothetical protein AAGI53_04230 [Planctomycetota bacterium]
MKTRAAAGIAALTLGTAFAPCAFATTTPDDPLPGDINLDGVVDLTDYSIILNNYNTSGQVTRAQGDTDWNYTIDIDDLLTVVYAWGQTQSAIPAAPGVSLVDSMGIAPTNGPITSLGDVFDAGDKVFRDRPLVDASLWAPAGVPPLAPTIDAAWLSDGVDLTLTYTNTSSVAMHPSSVRIPVLDRTGSKLYRDMKFGGKLSTPGYNSSNNWSGPMLGYPGSLYAPATVVENHTSNLAVGVSVQYPVLEYEQNVYIYQSDFGGNGGFLISILPNPDNPNTTSYDPAANIQPGETRTFTVSLRVRQIDFQTAHEGEWMHTLQTYRRWFRGNYGPVQYTRRPEQVNAESLSQASQLSTSNPYGFTYQSTRRPDHFGFGPWRAEWDLVAATGWERMMVWQPTGLYLTNTNNNFPPQFTSEWGSILSAVLPGYNDSIKPLATYAQETGGTLGLWWGRSMQVADTWDDPVLELFDPSNPTHVAFRANELNGAVDVEATEVGLDAFTKAGQWQSYWTLVDNRVAYPSIKFITESLHGDFVHTLAPNYAKQTKSPGSTTGQLYRFSQGVPIMDFLLPGHETWAQMEVRHIKTKLGLPSGANIPPEDTRPFIDEVADMGFVPVFFGTAATENTPTEFDAAETWLTTVPPALR